MGSVLRAAASCTTILLGLTAPLPAQGGDTRQYLSGAILRGGWPEGVDADVAWMAALRFSSALELDAALRIGGELVLAHHPARFEWYVSLGTGVTAAAVLPVGGLDALLAVESGSLVVKHWTAGSFCATQPVADAAEWSNVSRLWVFREGTRWRVYGQDPVDLRLLALEYDPTVGSPWQDSPDPWSALPTLALPERLRSLSSLDYHTGFPDEERVWLFEHSLLITDHGGQHLVLFGPATSTDLTAAMRSSSGVGHDLELWVTPVAGEQRLFSGNGTTNSGAAPYAFGAREFTDVLMLDLQAIPNSSSLPEVLLAEASLGLVTILEKSSTELTSPFRPIGGEYDTLDTYEDEVSAESKRGVACFAAGDFDLDGDQDMLAAHSEGRELRFWLNQMLPDERQRLYNAKPPSVEAMAGGGSEVLLTMPMDRNSAAVYVDFHVQVWIDRSYSGAELPTFHLDTIHHDTDPEVSFDFQYDPGALEPDHVCWISFTGVELGAGGAIAARHSTRLVYYSPSAAVEAELSQAHYPQLNRSLDEPPIGDTSGLRNGTRIGPGSGGPPP